MSNTGSTVNIVEGKNEKEERIKRAALCKKKWQEEYAMSVVLAEGNKEERLKRAALCKKNGKKSTRKKRKRVKEMIY